MKNENLCLHILFQIDMFIHTSKIKYPQNMICFSINLQENNVFIVKLRWKISSFGKFYYQPVFLLHSKTKQKQMCNKKKSIETNPTL